MAMQGSLLLLVSFEQNKRKISFEGSSIRELIEAVKKAFADVSDGSRISHLQYLDKDFDKYIDITDISQVQDRMKLIAVLKLNKKDDNQHEPMEVIASDSDTESGLPLVPYCTESVYNGPSSPTEVEMEIEGGAGAYALKQNLWVRRDVLFVYFMNPEVLEDEQWMCGNGVLNIDNILAWAVTWNPANCPDIPTFEKTDSLKKADIRIKFSGGGCVSIVGRLAENEDKSKPTMTLALKGLDPNMQKFLVIHEFGHALGLYHEHQRSDFWNHAADLLDIDKMKKDRRMKGVNFDRDILRKDYTSDDITNDYDSDSVMHYWVDIRWLKKKEHRDLKKVESDKKLTDDKKKILRAIHKRNNSYVLTPSAKDLEFLQEHYGGRVSRASPPAADRNTTAAAAAPPKTSLPSPTSKSLVETELDEVDKFLARHSQYQLTSDDVRLTTVLTKYINKNPPFLKIAKPIKNWEMVAEALGLTEADIAGIRDDNQNRVDNQKFKALRKWLSAGLIDGTATFLKLIRVLLEYEEIAAVLCVCEIAAKESF